MLHALDLLSTFAFALVGARIAANRKMDYAGIALIALVASVSGGTLRNVFLGIKPIDRKSTRLNSSHIPLSRMPSSA